MDNKIMVTDLLEQGNTFYAGKVGKERYYIYCTSRGFAIRIRQDGSNPTIMSGFSFNEMLFHLPKELRDTNNWVRK